MSNKNTEMVEFDAESVTVNDIDGEAEVLIHLPDSEEPVVLYLELSEYVKDVIESHSDLPEEL